MVGGSERRWQARGGMKGTMRESDRKWQVEEMGELI